MPKKLAKFELFISVGIIFHFLLHTMRPATVLAAIVITAFAAILPINTYSQALRTGDIRTGEPWTYYLPQASSNLTYNAAVPTPEAFFGFPVGEWHLRPDQVNAYIQELARVSGRIVLQDYATSYEQRRLFLAIISSPDNLKNLEAIKRQHKQLADPAQSLSASLAIEKMPVVVWLGATVHGNEPSGLNAIPLVAYFLAAAEGAEVQAWLRDAVIILDPCLNPDGAARFAHWANTNRGANAVADPQTREHNEGWLSGRFNHYWFDPNRDWLPLVHPEARGRVEKFHEWLPNVLTDHHEMGGKNAMFFFQPAAPSRNNPHVPEKVYDFTRQLAQYHARAMDSVGTLYFTKEYFDDFYVGKGATYPDLNGGVGILFEQGSSRGHAQESDNGTLTFASTIRNQVLASFSTLRGALALRDNLLSYQRDFPKTALQEAEKASVKGYVVGSPDAARNWHLFDLLRRHQIQMYELAKSTTLDGKRFEAGQAFVIPAVQPQYRLLTALFERRTTFQDSVFYDISAWTLPLAFGVNCVELKTKPTSELQGKRVDAMDFPKGRLATNPEAERGQIYAFHWNGYYAPRALMRLLKAGIIVKTATKPFEAQTAEGKIKFGYGAITIPVGIQSSRASEIRRIMEAIAREDAVTVYALQTGLAEAGIDVGSRNMVNVEKPRVAVLVGEGVTPADAGEIWHLLDARFGFEVTLFELSQLGRIDLTRYNTLVMPNGRYSGLDKSDAETLKSWVETGGVLIGVEDAVQWLTKYEFIKTETKKVKTEKEAETPRRDYAALEQDAGAQSLDGAIFEARLDNTHPLGYGYEDRSIAVFRSNKVFLEPSKNPYGTPLQYTANPLLSGYISGENLKLLKNAGDVLAGSIKSGRVIGFTSNPNFRAFWFGTNKLFLNAILFGRTISDRAALWGGKITE